MKSRVCQRCGAAIRPARKRAGSAAPAPRFSHTPLERPRAPSNAGWNTRQVLGELGYDEAAIGMLLRHRVATEE